jgi:hypothetical protein
MYRGFWWGDLLERHHLEDLVNGRVMLQWTFRKWNWVMYWIDLAQDRDRWGQLVKAVMKLRVA